MYNTENEKNLVESTYPDTQSIKSDIAGVGFEQPIFEKNKERKIKTPYFVYIGRIEVNKGCKELVDYFSKMNNTGIKLILIGKNHLNTPINSENIILTGFIDESEKLHYLQHCEALIIPSKYESLSMVTLEAMSAGKPVLANGHCEVLETHIEKSNAGFVYYDREDFTTMIEKILDLSDEEKREIEHNGKYYVNKNFQWDAIIEKFISAINYIDSEYHSI